MKKELKFNLEWIYIYIFVFLAAVLFVNRLFYGIETSDEAYYSVTGYRMLQGNIPFGDMWEQSAGDAYHMFPFLMMRSLFIHSTEGLQIYLRLSFFVLSLVGLWAVYMYVKGSMRSEHAFLLGTTILFYAPFQLYNFSYNNLSILFVTSSFCMMFVALKNEHRIYVYLSGVFMALGVLAYPTMVYCCLILAMVIIVISILTKKIRLIAGYALGGITVAFPIIVHLYVTVGLSDVMKNLRFILSTGSTPSLSPTRLLLCIWDSIQYWKTPFEENGKWFCLYITIVAILSINKKTKLSGKYLLVLYPLICICYSINGGVSAIMSYIFPIALSAPIAVLLSNDRKSMIKKYAFEWGLSVIIYFVIGFSSGGGAANARDGLIFAAIVSLKLIIEAMQEEPTIKLEKTCIYALIMTFIIGEVLLFYMGVYRDEAYFALTEKVDSGVYKGIHTTPERKRHIEDLQSVMLQIEDKGESVMILYHSCYAYLMVDMLPKIPTSWGCISFQEYGYDNQQQFMEYLAREENIPENIMIIDIPDEYDYAVQKIEEFEPYYPELNNYIENHYTFLGEYETGKSGTVIKYEVDWDTF